MPSVIYGNCRKRAICRVSLMLNLVILSVMAPWTGGALDRGRLGQGAPWTGGALDRGRVIERLITTIGAILLKVGRPVSIERKQI